MKRILVFHPNLPPYRVDLFNALFQKANVKIVFMSRSYLTHSFNVETLANQLKGDYQFLTTGFNYKHYVFRYGIKRIILEFQPDVIVSYEFSILTIWLCFWKLYKRQPWALVTLTDDSIDMVVNNGFCKRLLKRWCLGRLDGLLVGTKNIRDTYADMYDFDKIQIGICPVLQGDDSLRIKIGEGIEIATHYINRFKLKNKKVVLFVGRLAKEKNLPLLLKAFAYASNEDWKLVLVGEGKERARLENLAKELKIDEKVVLPGRYEEKALYAWYWLGGIFVLPSRYEPFGAVVNEALAAGIPCLVSEKAGAACLIETKEHGEIFNIGDYKKLGQLLAGRMEEVKTLKGRLGNNLPPSLFGDKFNQVANGVVEFLGSVKNGSQGCNIRGRFQEK